ncbi:MAG: lytic murein transglycosylase B [Proteobacteria bacterium]|nr:lytic murein transglycosylase B [Pseudomonadota bacterium]
MQRRYVLKFMLCCLCFFSIFTLSAQEKQFTDRDDVKTFIQMMVQKHHFESSQLKSWLNKATIQPSILKAIAKPAEKLPWHRYQPIFLTQQRIDGGVAFWEQNQTALLQAQKKYGVPPEIIIAIIGVETFYGKQTGQYSVLDSLVTLGFEYPPRSQFFLSELAEFLLLAREEKWDPTQVKGSYAGAMGKAQFIASSYRRYGIDFNQNGHRDLINNVDDAIGSVANYFKVHGWQKDALIVIPASVSGDKFQKVLASNNNPKPSFKFENISQLGISLKQSIPYKQKQDPFSLISLEGKSGPEYWLGANNFYVITRYNHSSLYAMAVYDLSEKIKAAYLNKAL